MVEDFASNLSILETLQTDHRQVKEHLKTILSTADAKKRSDLFKQFRTELTAHSRAEEKVLYRGMEKSEEGKDDALEGAVEHEVVDRLIEDLSRSRSIGSDKWTTRCTVLQELLEHHIDEEEGEFFGRRVGSAKQVSDGMVWARRIGRVGDPLTGSERASQNYHSTGRMMESPDQVSQFAKRVESRPCSARTESG